MAINRILFILGIYVFNSLQGCSESIKEKTAGPGFLKNINRIEVYNKTQNKFIAEKIEITDTTKIIRISEEIRGMKNLSISDLKANFGFYEINLIDSNEKRYEIDVFYTVYNGVVIRDMSGGTYKNDALEALILYYFQK